MIRQKVIDNYRDMVASLKTELKLAEAEVEQLQALLEKYNAKCAVCDHVSEIMRLRKVADAARGVFLGEGEYLCSEFKNDIDRLRQALAELDKEES